jgi:hypothetical protein
MTDNFTMQKCRISQIGEHYLIEILLDDVKVCEFAVEKVVVDVEKDRRVLNGN